jgi:hypothetical protein
MTKLAYFQVIDGDEETIRELGLALKEIKEKHKLDIDFLIGNEKIQLRDVKHVIDELYELYKLEQKLIKKEKGRDKK